MKFMAIVLLREVDKKPSVVKYSPMFFLKFLISKWVRLQPR